MDRLSFTPDKLRWARKQSLSLRAAVQYSRVANPALWPRRHLIIRVSKCNENTEVLELSVLLGHGNRHPPAVQQCGRRNLTQHDRSPSHPRHLESGLHVFAIPKRSRILCVSSSFSSLPQRHITAPSKLNTCWWCLPGWYMIGTPRASRATRQQQHRISCREHYCCVLVFVIIM